MRAWQHEEYGAAEALRLVERDELAAPGPGRVTIAVEAVAVEAASLHLMTGEPAAVRLTLGWRRPRRPRVPGVQAAGTVLAVGERVAGLAAGDRVAGFVPGSLVDAAHARADRVARIPDSVSFEAAATLPVSAGTALAAARALGLADPGSGSGMRVAVLGAAGSVGSPLTALLARAGAEVTAVARADAGDHLRTLGARRLLDYRRNDVLEGGEVYDAVIDLADGRPVRALRAIVAPRGALVIVGAERGGGALLGPAARQLHALAANPFTRQRLIPILQEESKDDIAHLAELVAADQLPPAVAAVVPFTDAPSAYALFARGGSFGTIVIGR